MQFREMMPWRRRDEEGHEPYHALQRRMNEMFEDFFDRFRMPSLSWPEGARFGAAPRVNVSEKNGHILVEAEVPGLEEKDLDVSLSEDLVTISGERKEEKEEKEEQWYRHEFAYGSFRRSIPLPARVNTDEAKASFKKGVLTIDLPVVPEEQQKTKKIPVRTE